MNHQFNLNQYSQLNTIPAVVGILFAVSAGVQFLDVSVTIGVVGYSFDPAHAMMVSLGALVVAFASSETKDWRYYDRHEQAVVGLAVVLIVGTEYVVEVSDAIANNAPVAGFVAFAVSMAAWGVLSR